jgi:single-stranded-DNA-specific exonuclease
MTYHEESKQFRCSARGVKELNLYDIISNLSDFLDGFGGHQLAGGFSFSEEKISFENIKKALNQTVDEMLNGQKLNPSLDIDLEIGVDDIDISLVEEINKLEPFGMLNPSPTFAIKNMTLKQKKLMGSTKEHLKLIIDTPRGAKDCVWWSKGDIPLIAGDKLDIAFAPQLNTFNGTTDIQLIIKDIHSEALLAEEKSDIKIYDHRKKTDIFAQVDDYIKNSKLGISVFVEDLQIKETLKPYKNISEKIINRQNACKNDVLMFFDYPCDSEVLDSLKQAVCASAFHYMNYQNYKVDEEKMLKSFASMIRYSANNLEGKFSLLRGACALGVNEEVIETLLEIFQEAGMIKIESRDSDSYKINIISDISLAKTLHTTKYAEFVELMNTINDYKNKFMQIDL